MQKESGFKRLYSKLKVKCKERNIFLDLPYDTFKELIVKDCHYCGVAATATNNEPCLKGFKFNGLDRVDSKKGYYISNIVPSCPTCNSMKSSLTSEEFYNHIKRIVANS